MGDVGAVLEHALRDVSAPRSSRLGWKTSNHTDTGRLAVDDDTLHARIVEHFEAGRFVFTDHALTRRPFAEGF